MCLFYRKPDSCGSMITVCQGVCWDSAQKEAPGTAQRPPEAPRPSPQQWFPGVSRSSVIIPFRFLRKRKVQAHICTQKFYTAQVPETGVLQMAGVSKCKRKRKLCRREKKIKGVVINVVLDMLHGESYFIFISGSEWSLKSRLLLLGWRGRLLEMMLGSVQGGWAWLSGPSGPSWPCSWLALPP